MVKNIIYGVGSLSAGFIAGIVANNIWEVNKLYGYGVKAITVTADGRAFGVDDLILIGIGLALLILGYLKMPLLAWFGVGWILAQLADKVAECM